MAAGAMAVCQARPFTLEAGSAFSHIPQMIIQNAKDATRNTKSKQIKSKSHERRTEMTTKNEATNPERNTFTNVPRCYGNVKLASGRDNYWT